MRRNARNHTLKTIWGSIFIAALAVAPVLAQAQQYPPPQGQYRQTQQYPPQQYPQQQQQYPPQQGRYPPQGGQYPPQAQYPPVEGQYPPPQGAYSQPPMLPPQQLDQLVQSIALYPDGLLAQVLTASTFANQIPDAVGWANQHSYLTGPALAQAIQGDYLPWDPSVIALLPFPSVLNQMANNMGWTQELGSAVLAQRDDVMDAVQSQRQLAYNYGYLRPNQYERIVYAPGEIQIVPVNPGLYYVPYYDPYIVYARPRPGFVVGGAIRFGGGTTIGAFAPWGWGGVGFGWREHTILVANRPWDRTWVNRGSYRPYYGPGERDRFVPGPRAEHHDLRGPAHYEGEHHDHERERERDHDRR